MIKMDPNWMEAEERNIDALYESIRSDPYILDKADEIPFVDTPLHKAASVGQTRLAIEIRNLKPSLGRKLNPDGLSPLHLALLNGHFEIVKGLIKLDRDLIRVKGREWLTPLHYAAETNDRINILAEFLLACPESIEDLNARDETALHIAVKTCSEIAVGVLMGCIRKTDKHRFTVINTQDGRGNTVLHAAVSTSQPQIVESVVRGYKLHMNVKNLEGATALDIAERLAPGSARTEIISILRRARASKSSSLDHDCSLVDFFTLRESWMETIFRFFVFVREGMSMEMRNVILVVAVLITTATFQAVLSPPGGSGVCSGGLSDDSSLFANATMSMSSTSRLPITNISHINAAIFTSTKKLPKLFLAFYAMNTVSFIASIAMIILVLPFHVFAPLHASLMFLTLSYGFSFLFLPPMRDFGLIFAPSVIVIAFLFYTVHLVHDMIEYRLKIHKGLLFMSYLKKNRLRMLYRVALD